MLEGKREVNLEKLFCSFPNAYCLLVNITRSILQRIKTVPVLSGYTGLVRSIPVYLALTMQCIEQGGLQITWYYQVPWANPVPQ